MDTLTSLIYTFSHRPYILAFLIGFLIVGILNMGTKRTLLFLLLGYGIALASEACSIRTGFPYGWYSYLYDAMPGELMVFGVPVWDSLSYTFMTFASLSMAEWMMMRSPLLQRGVRGDYTKEKIKLVLIASILTVLLDVLADPLASHGDKWFLGKMYEYAEPGFYFGIPLTNFAGWFLVAFTIIGSFVFLNHVGAGFSRPNQGANTAPLQSNIKWRANLGPLLYISLILFNLSLTLWIGEILIALCGFVLVDITLLLGFLLSGYHHRSSSA